jgi:hypothetical protein
MDITIKNLGVISDEEGSFVKFVLLEEKILAFGKCLWHKDLIIALYGQDTSVSITAAGILPKDVSKTPLDDEYWGQWRSNGYDVITPPEYRSLIQKALLSFESEINTLWGR